MGNVFQWIRVSPRVCNYYYSTGIRVCLFPRTEPRADHRPSDRSLFRLQASCRSRNFPQQGGGVVSTEKAGPANTDIVVLSEDNREYPVDALGTAEVRPLVSGLVQDSHRDAFTALALNYVSLQQQVAEASHFKELVSAITLALEGIPSWDVGDNWTAERLLDTMLRTGLDTVTETTGGIGFMLLHGSALGLRDGYAKDEMMYLFSATAQEAFEKMVARGLSFPKFGDEHTPLFKTVCNTDAPVTYDQKVLHNLTLQKRANLPQGHFIMKTVSLLPFGGGTNGVLVGLANGKYPGALVPEVVRVMRRFLAGVTDVHKRVTIREKAKSAAKIKEKMMELNDQMHRTCNRASQSSGSLEDKIKATVKLVPGLIGISAAFVYANDAGRRPGEAGFGDGGGSEAGVSFAPSGQPKHKRKKAASTKATSRSSATAALGLRFDSFELGDTVAADTAENLEAGSLEDLLRGSPNTPHILRRVLGSGEGVVLEGDDMGVFEGAMVSPTSSLVIVPIQPDGLTRGLWIVLGDSAQVIQASIDVYQRVVGEHIRTLYQFATQGKSSNPLACIPESLKQEIQDLTKTRAQALRGLTGAESKALARSPLWTWEPSAENPMALLRATVSVTAATAASLSALNSGILTATVLDELATMIKADCGGMQRVVTEPDTLLFAGGWEPLSLRPLVRTCIAAWGRANELALEFLASKIVGEPVPMNAVDIKLLLVHTTDAKRGAMSIVDASHGMVFGPVGAVTNQLRTMASLPITAPLVTDAQTGRLLQAISDSSGAHFAYLPDSVKDEGHDPKAYVMVVPQPAAGAPM